MGRVVVLDNPMDTREARTYEHSGPLIDFLLEHFPAGFSGPHVALLGLRRLPVEDYDCAVADDTVVLAMLPAGPFAVPLAQAVIGALVAAALNYAINTFFGPKASKPAEPAALTGLPSASPTYSLNTPTNVARIGQPIPVAYGRNPIVPDLASQPYAWYEGNNMYLGMYLCLGQGEFDIHSVKLANTEASDMAAGVVTYSVYNSAQHGQAFGFLQSSTGIYENAYTSPEVSGQELLGDIGGVYSSSVSLWNGTWSTYSGAIFYLNGAQAVAYVQYLKAGTPVWIVISGSAHCDGAYQVSFIEGAGYTQNTGQAEYARKGHLAPGVSWPVGSDAGTAVLTIVDPASSDTSAPVGPFAASPVGISTSLLSYDIVFPQGCYSANSGGGLAGFTVSAEFRVEEIDDDGELVPGGYVGTYQYVETHATNTQQRRTLWHTVPNGRYQVTGFRTSNKSDQASDRSELTWTGLKAILGNTMGDTVYGDTTIIAMMVKATEGVSSDVANRVTVDCTRKLNGAATRNPIDAFVDVFTNQRYGGRRPTVELDTATLSALRTAWSGETFDAVFDQDSTIWEAAGLAVQMQHAFPTTLGATISVVEDKNHTTPYFSLTEDTIKSISEQYLFTDGEEPDGVEGEYRDPDDGAALYAIYPADSVRPESVTLWGCRSYADALAYVTQRWKQLSLRRRIITVEIEAEGNVLPVGVPVNLNHRLLGTEPVMCVVNAVAPKDEFSVTLEMHRHVPEVFT